MAIGAELDLEHFAIVGLELVDFFDGRRAARGEGDLGPPTLPVPGRGVSDSDFDLALFKGYLLPIINYWELNSFSLDHKMLQDRILGNRHF